MKVLSTICLLLVSVNLLSQWTKGGSTKNYEKYSVKLDSVKRVEQIQIPVKNTSYTYMGIGLLNPSSDEFNTIASPIQIAYGEGFLGGLFSSGNMGGTMGFSAEIGGIQQFKNRNLTPYLDLGGTYDISYSAIRWKFPSTYETDPTFNQLYHTYVSSVKGGTFHNLAYRLGLNLTINPKPKEDLVRADIFFRAGVGFVFGGVKTKLDVYSYENFTDINGDETWDGTIEHKDEDIAALQIPLQFGVNIRILEKFYIGFRYNFRMLYNNERSETRDWVYQYNNYESSTFYYDNVTYTSNYSSNVDLKNLTFNLGIVIPNTTSNRQSTSNFNQILR